MQKNALEANIISPFIYSKLDKKVLSILKSLQYIATRSTGFDHIDLSFCSKKGIFGFKCPQLRRKYSC